MNCNSFSWCSKLLISFFLNKNPLIFFCNFIILNIVFHHSWISAIFLVWFFISFPSSICLFIEVAYSILLINTAVLSAFFNSFFPYPLAIPNLFMPSFLGIGVKEFSGNNVTILLALLLILPIFPLFRQFSRFCGLFKEFFLIGALGSCLRFCNWTFFK